MVDAAKEAKKYFLDTEVIVHAGGLGEQWWPITKGKIPKPLTCIGKNSRPIFDWVILPLVMAGTKKFFVSLWHNPEHLIKHCEELSSNIGIEFVFLREPADKRLGRAGVIKHYLEQAVLDKNKPKLSMNGADVLKINMLKVAAYHCDGLKKGFQTTVVCTNTEPSKFGKIKCNSTTAAVNYFEEKPMLHLPKGEFVNTGMFYFDSKLNKLLLEIKDSELPVDIESSSVMPKLCKTMRCLDCVEPIKSWLWFKTSKDFNTFKSCDLEKFFGISSVEKYLGEFSNNNENMCE